MCKIKVLKKYLKFYEIDFHAFPLKTLQEKFFTFFLDFLRFYSHSHHH